MSRNLRAIIPLGTVIADRELLFQRSGQAPQIIRIQIGAPVPDPAYPGNSLCPVVLLGFEREEKLVLGGIDSLQALTFALHALSSFVQLCARQHGGSLTWLGQPDLGLPKPSTTDAPSGRD